MTKSEAAPKQNLFQSDAMQRLLAFGALTLIFVGFSIASANFLKFDNVVGILLAKDLLRLCTSEEVNLREQLRPAVFIPESKRLNVLLREFRASRNHIAIVVDEYGGVAGLVTIEDVLEQIVGDIEDEFDYDEAEDNILQFDSRAFRVKAQTEIGDFNLAIGTSFTDDEFDTVGGVVTHAFGRVPKRGESVEICGLRFQVLRADSRRIHSLRVERPSQAT